MSGKARAQSVADEFEANRRRLLGLAYRMLGSMADAEDAVQEAYVRWDRVDRARVKDAKAFLMTTTARVCIDVLASARVRREQYVGTWLPEPILDASTLAPDASTELAEDLSYALLLTLDRLSPLERAAFLLHDIFDYPFADVASALDRSESACRQLASRARSRVRAARRGETGAQAMRSGEVDAKHVELISAFATATQSGDLSELMRMLASDVKLAVDGGGVVRAVPNEVQGAENVARLIIGATRPHPGSWWRDDFWLRIGAVNGLPGLIVDSSQGPVQTTAFEIESDVVRAMYVVRNPDKLRHLTTVRRDSTHKRQ